jgi:hypothetical protein
MSKIPGRAETVVCDDFLVLQIPYVMPGAEGLYCAQPNAPFSPRELVLLPGMAGAFRIEALVVQNISILTTDKRLFEQFKGEGLAYSELGMRSFAFKGPTITPEMRIMLRVTNVSSKIRLFYAELHGKAVAEEAALEVFSPEPSRYRPLQPLMDVLEEIDCMDLEASQPKRRDALAVQLEKGRDLIRKLQAG